MIYVALLYVLCFVVGLYVFQICSGFKLKSCIYRNGLFLFVLMVVIIAFGYQPLITDDLYRYHLLIDKMRNKSFEWILFSSPYIHEPLSNLIFFTVSKMTSNNNIYQVIGVVFIYGIFFLNLRKITTFNISKEENLYIVTFLSYIILLFSISGTRNTMAAMFFSFALLREKENKYSWIFYLFSVCTHISMLPIVIIRILCFFLPKKRINFIHILLLFWAFLIKFILKNLYNIHNIYISTIVRKANVYLFEKNNIIDKRYIIAILILNMIMLFVYLMEFNKKNPYIRFMGYLIFFTLGCNGANVLLERYTRVLCACMLPMFMGLSKNKNLKLIIYILPLLDIGMFGYQIVMFITHFKIWFL